MPFVFKGTTIKKLTYQATAIKKHIAKGVQVWTAEETLPNLSGWAASSGSPENSGIYYREVTSGDSWDLTGFDTIETIAGTTSKALSYWTGGDRLKGTRYIYLVFADGTTHLVKQWDYYYNYYAPENDTPDFSAVDVDISAYTAEQKKTVKLKYVNAVDCGGTYGSNFTELSFSTTTVIAS